MISLLEGCCCWIDVILSSLVYTGVPVGWSDTLWCSWVYLLLSQPPYRYLPRIVCTSLHLKVTLELHLTSDPTDIPSISLSQLTYSRAKLHSRIFESNLFEPVKVVIAGIMNLLDLLSFLHPLFFYTFPSE